MSAALRLVAGRPLEQPVADSYLHPGEICVTAQPVRVTTILGSCVSVCLFDSQARVAGLNHFLLPQAPRAGEASPRHGDVAIEVLVRRLLAIGASCDRLVAKLFGGANVLRAFADESRHIGAANVDLARSTLARYGIPIGAEDVGGTRGRKLVFSAPDGAAWVKVIGP